MNRDAQRPTYSRRPPPKKFCRFCSDANLKIDFKDAVLLREFVTERGKIMPRRINGLCAKHQRELSSAIKRARMLALLPYTTLKTSTVGR